MLNFGMNENNIFTGLYSSLIQIYKKLIYYLYSTSKNDQLKTYDKK